MGKPTNIAAPARTTAHAQAAEFAMLAGANKVAATVLTDGSGAAMAALQDELAAEKESHAATASSLIEANAQVEALTAELTAEKEAHAKANAALAAATAT